MQEEHKLPGRPKGGFSTSEPGRPPFTLNAIGLCVSLAFAAPLTHAQQAPQRLSAWLLSNKQPPDAYPLGLSWRVPDEIGPQSALQLKLLESLSGRDRSVRADAAAVERLRRWLEVLPVTGRVPVASPDGYWLAGNPSRDPILLPGHSVVVPVRPGTVTVVRADGALCRVGHEGGRESYDYVEACGQHGADWAWIAQPDGRVQRYGVARWNREKQDDVAPGAWIWAPPRDGGWPRSFSDGLIAFLATQGPASDPVSRHSPSTASGTSCYGLASSPGLIVGQSSEDVSRVSPDVGSGHSCLDVAFRTPSRRSVGPFWTSSDWGNTGLVQTPSARMKRAGDFWFTISRAYPYTRASVMFQPFEWMEAGFRYSTISNRAYGPPDLSGDQSAKDKSIDLKLRLVEEDAYLPQVALGFRDLAGSGLFSGEYLVANKRTGGLDWSLGLGWGYLGARGNVKNPFALVSKRFETRKTVETGQAGSLSYGDYFHGSAAVFGGVQYQLPWERWVAKLEYDGNDYQHEPISNNLKVSSPFNFGVVYRAGKAVDLSIGFERGNRVMLGLTLHSQLDRLSQLKLADPPRVPVSPTRPMSQPDWDRTSRDIKTQTDWDVSAIEQRNRELRITLNDASAVYWRDRVDKAAAVLHRDAPGNVDTFTFAYRNGGQEVAEHLVDRDGWVQQHTQPALPSIERASVIARAPAPAMDAPGSVVYERKPERFKAGMRLSYIQTLGGPDGFVLYQISALESARLRVTDSTWLDGAVRLRLIDNYDKFKYTAPSNLPRVRTFLREYLTTSRVTMPNLQLTHVGKLTDNQYYSVYGGYLEEMFGGVGAEWMYRPFGSPVAYGIDINQVKQRDFQQDFGFRDYKATTGHATLYWDTGWNDVLVNLSAGKYLAGDTGATLGVSRVFKNGISIGAFATFTNVSKEQFGEGSFDKGIFVNLPFDVFLTKSSNTVGSFVWKPLTRDGGAKLARQVNLYDVTNPRNNRALDFAPAPLSNENLIPADRPGEWTPPASLQTPHVAIAPQPLSVEWGDTKVENRELVSALYGMGFSNVVVSYETTHTLAVTLSTERIRPLSRAVALAARTAARLAPLDTREIRIKLIERTVPAVTYDFLDLATLQRYLGGGVSEQAFADTVTVEYQNPAAIEKAPLAGFKDLDLPAKPAVTNPLPETFSFGRVAGDYKAAAGMLGDVNWLRAGIYGAGAIAGSATLDRRAFTFADNHKDARWLKAGVSFGNALPWLGLGASAATAFASSDPQLSRTSYAATEAGMAAILASTGVKYVVGRARPETGLGTTEFQHFSNDNRYGAFPSRHTAVAWAVVTPYALEYDAKWLYGAAALTNLARIGSREHWVSDTVGGSLLGYGLGRIFWQSGKERGKNQPRVMVQPNGAAVSWDFK